MKIYLFAALLLLARVCYCQPVTARPYEIGDSFHASQIGNVLFQEEPLDMRLFKGKLTIIDFWGLNCYSCIVAIPKLDSLQREFKDRLQIVMVTKDKRKSIEAFFARRKSKVPAIPIIVEDTVLSSYFPYKYLPHHVWINEQGKVIYITSGENTNGVTLQAYFKGKKLDFTETVTLMDFDPIQPIWKEGGGRLSHRVKYYSMLSGYLLENPYYYMRITDDEKGITNLKLLNVPLLDLYKIAYGGLRGLGDLAKDNRIILEVNDRSVFRENDPLKMDSWQRENSYCYEAATPPLSEIDFCRLLQEELSRYFPYNATIEKRKTKIAKDKFLSVEMLVIRDKPINPYAKINR